MNLTRDLLLKELECKTELVKLSSGDVLVAEYSATDHMNLCRLCATNDYEKEGVIKLDIEKFNAGKIAFCVVDVKTKERIFTDDDIPFLMKSSAKISAILIEKINQINGLTSDLGNDLKPIESDSVSGE
jgi:hypothetical protein